MRLRPNFALLALGVVALFVGPAAAMAEATPFTGPVVPGVCLLSQDGVFTNAKVGQAATARLRQLAQTPANALNVERQGLEADAKTLDGQKTALSASVFHERQQALAVRGQAYQAKVQALGHQIDATRQKVIAQIAQAAQPVIAQVYQARGCGLLLSRDAVLAGNMSNDLTPAVVQGLDAKLTTISFDLEPAAAATPAQ